VEGWRSAGAEVVEALAVVVERGVEAARVLAVAEVRGRD
jgi:hypothetical protein